MPQKILITSALPYANGPLHFGHIAGAYLPGDCYARFQRLLGNDVLYICGSDEYGVAITLSAELAKRTPKEHVDIYHHMIQDFFKKLDLSFDHYSRTTWSGHVADVQEFFLDLLKNGFIEEKITDQLYSEEDRRFLADRYVVGTCPKCGFEEARGDECQKCGSSYEATDLKNPRSKLTGHKLVLKPTKHWFLRFDLFKDRLASWIMQKHWKSNVLNFAKSYIEDLHPRAITRDSDWGVPIPLKGTEGKVFYVWFDAPIGYISATRDWAQTKDKPEAWKEYWFDPDTKLVQFIGKDNIPFHAVFFPAMTMGQDKPYKLVDELPANEFLNLEGRQFSKSEGWYIDLDDFFKQFSADQIRYYLAANAPESQDAEFSWKDFQARCNSELLGKFGNLA
ncbi:MAG TPA: methionine--tRNA ligase, partial [Rhabdochlamydiaceae bacterium]|nr:methionine--tRNA ligase [Rhabdochlamydiaceae bacterium]